MSNQTRARFRKEPPLSLLRLAMLCDSLITDHGWTQSEIGSALSLSQPTVSSILLGRIAKIYVSTIEVARDSLGLDPAYFFDAELRGDGTYRAYLSEESRISEAAVRAETIRRGRPRKPPITQG